MAHAPPSEGESSPLSLWERVSFAVVHAAASSLLFVLTLRGLYHFARFFGTLEWITNYKRRRRFTTALESILGHRPSAKQRRQAGREYFCQSRCDRLFYLIFDQIPRRRAQELLTIGNDELLNQAVSRGRGVYVTLAHHGAQHVIGFLMALHGYKIAGVRDRRESPLRRYVQNRFDRLYPEFARARVLFAESFPRDIYRCLHEGYLLGSALDVSRVRDPNQKYEEAALFGERRLFPTGPLRIALRCRSPVLQAFIIPESGFRYRLDFVGMLLDPETVADEAASVRKAIETYVDRVEQRTREMPSLITRI